MRREREMWRASPRRSTQGPTSIPATATRRRALFFAADRGHVEVIKLLLDRGADINALDTFYKFRPMMMAMMNNHTPAVRLLLERGSEGAGAVLAAGGGIGRQGAGRCRAEGERPDCCRTCRAHSRQPSAVPTRRS